MRTERNGRKVVIIDTGPAGLTCTGDLNVIGYSVAAFEALYITGDVLMYGIPQFRLPKEITQKEIDLLKSNGVAIEADMVIGKVPSVDELFEVDFGAVFIGSDAGLSSFINIPDEGFIDVYSANESLTRTDLTKAYKEGYDTPIIRPENVAVCDSGNVAMDAVCSIRRPGVGNVYIIHRHTEEQMPARREEIHHAKEEEIDLRLLTDPVTIHDDENGRVTGIECIRTEFGESDASGRRKLVEVKDSNFRLSVDYVATAIGNPLNSSLQRTMEGLETNRHSRLVVNEEALWTTREGVFVGGDAVTDAATVILAMGEGKHVANSIDEYIKSKK